ncbi:uncharacterized protein C8orf88 isoform X2 [Xenopus laevis]|uniref:Granulito n=1 Tax=Xenopus laevis TaxID=8355 RepID=A0A0I9QQ40_XENLA|nr:uncharacterized protein C8orf88 isoform X2 [Xenopus laevis]DAA64906.1 TPA_inf: Granulito [Xenopus laevis]
MEVKKLIGKSLQPARPIRRVVMHKGPMPPSLLKNLSFNQEKSSHVTALDSEPVFMFNIRAEFTDCLINDIEQQLDLWCSISNHDEPVKDSMVPTQAEALQPEAKKADAAGRITYTRDFLVELSNVSACRKRPQYLPDHPIVLKEPICNNTHATQFLNN